LGCVLFELLTGSCAFDGQTLMQLSAAILESNPVPLRTYLPEAPEELETIILRCLEKDLSDRVANVAELAALLYPFAPRRARISAERCNSMLRSAGITTSALKLASAPPPALPSIDPMDDEATLLRLPASQSRRVPSSRGQRTLSVPEIEVYGTSAPRKRGSTFLFVGAAILAAGAGWYVFRGQGIEGSASTKTSTKAVAEQAPAQVAPPAAAAPTPAKTAEEANAANADATKKDVAAAETSTPEAATRTAAQRSKATKSTPAPVINRSKPRASAGRSASGHDEWDVGF
jgi:hypothetical protein